MGTTVGQSRKDTGATDISIKLFVMVWVETAKCPLSLFLFVCFDKHLTEFGQRLSFCFWKKDPE